MDVQSSWDRLWVSKVPGIIYGCPKSPGSSMDVQSSWDRLWMSKVPGIVYGCPKFMGSSMGVQSPRDRLWVSKVPGIVYGCPKSPGSSMGVQSPRDRLWMSKVPGISRDSHGCPKFLSTPNLIGLAELYTENAAKGDWQNETFQKSKRYQQIQFNFPKV